ncbi:amino acid ABC transporter permease [Paraburkholderia sp. J12]|uniref:amino acid ABC transporter permease n=1 Tax=Paraburkholderia sp. J12 TaxID=2805432 RepID=UPI002ABDD213|nr:amino acid ABC transporter permease [Paraburkholderia sp. J12]
MFDAFDFSVIGRSLPYLFGVGMVFTVKLTLMAMVGGSVLGTFLALMRLSHVRILRVAAGAYVNIIRSLPLILVIFWFFFLVPYIGGWIIRSNEPIEVGAFSSALITFVMFEAAYYCEIIRAGIRGVPLGQVYAAQAIGMNYTRVMVHVVLPQAFRAMLPLILTQSIVLLQDVSLVYVVSITDFVGAAAAIAQRDGRLLEMYLFVALVYFTICFILSSLVRHMAQRRAV